MLKQAEKTNTQKKRPFSKLKIEFINLLYYPLSAIQKLNEENTLIQTYQAQKNCVPTEKLFFLIPFTNIAS